MNQVTKLEAIIVLGAGKIDSRRRVRYAAEIARTEDFPIIVTGANWEAEDMEEELIRNGISPARIKREGKACNTLANIEYSKQKLEEIGITSGKIGIVSGKAHLSRASRFAKRLMPEYKIIRLPVPIRNRGDIALECVSLFTEIFIPAIKDTRLVDYLKKRAYLDSFPKARSSY